MIAFLQQYCMHILPGVMLAVSAAGFVLMCVDKARAVRHRGRRIPERTLLIIGVLLGAFGILFGMLLLRHKTNAKRHPAFAYGVPLLAIAQGGAVICLLVL